MSQKIPNEVKEYCKRFKLCHGCKFVGAECVAPTMEPAFNKWIQKMNDLILTEIKNERKDVPSPL